MLAVTDAVVLFWVVVQGGSVGKLIERLPADVGPPTPPKRTDNDVCGQFSTLLLLNLGPRALVSGTSRVAAWFAASFL